MELQQLASKLPWTNALEVWKLNGSLKKRRGHRKGGNAARVKPEPEACTEAGSDTEQQEPAETVAASEGLTEAETCAETSEELTSGSRPLKFRVTCNRAGDKHSFSSNEAARDFGGAVQEFFQWKADMTKFDIEVGVLVQTGRMESEYHNLSQKTPLSVVMARRGLILRLGSDRNNKYEESFP